MKIILISDVGGAKISSLLLNFDMIDEQNLKLKKSNVFLKMCQTLWVCLYFKNKNKYL